MRENIFGYIMEEEFNRDDLLIEINGELDMNRSQASLMRLRMTRHKLETKSIESDRIIIIINSMG